MLFARIVFGRLSVSYGLFHLRPSLTVSIFSLVVPFFISAVVEARLTISPCLALGGLSTLLVVLVGNRGSAERNRTYSRLDFDPGE